MKKVSQKKVDSKVKKTKSEIVVYSHRTPTQLHASIYASHRKQIRKD